MAKPQSIDVAAALKQTDIFSALEESALDAFADKCAVIHRKAGDRIFGPSEEADRFFVVLSGQVKIYKLSAKGDEQILHAYGAGETFGGAAVFAGINYPAFADATADTTLLQISRRVLHDEIASNADLAIGMLAGLSSKLREFAQLIEQLSLREVPARLGAVLLAEAQKAGADSFTLSQSKRQLAAQIGTAPETLSRALKKMSKSGLISVDGAKITIRNIRALQDLAAGE